MDKNFLSYYYVSSSLVNNSRQHKCILQIENSHIYINDLVYIHNNYKLDDNILYKILNEKIYEGYYKITFTHKKTNSSFDVFEIQEFNRTWLFDKLKDYTIKIIIYKILYIEFIYINDNDIRIHIYYNEILSPHKIIFNELMYINKIKKIQYIRRIPSIKFKNNMKSLKTMSFYQLDTNDISYLHSFII